MPNYGDKKSISNEKIIEILYRILEKQIIKLNTNNMNSHNRKKWKIRSNNFHLKSQ